MRTTGRRRVDRILLGAGAIVGGGIVAIGSAVGDGERIPQMWVGAELSSEGGTVVTEVIDYDFGLVPKHGIFRTVPGLDFDSPVTVESATAPDDIAAFVPTFIGGEAGMELKIGDPNTTITGRHRYLLDYELPATCCWMRPTPSRGTRSAPSGPSTSSGPRSTSSLRGSSRARPAPSAAKARPAAASSARSSPGTSSPRWRT